MRKFLWAVLLSLSYSIATAQVLPKVYNQFFMNPYIYNPAYAGVEGHTVLFFMYKQQWTNVNGAPAMAHANFHVPLKGGLAIGAMAYNETNGLYNQSAGKVSAGYLISIDREHFFRFGMSLGAGNNTLDFGEFDSPNDPAFANLVTNESFLIGDVGASYHFGHFNVGLSLPSLFGYELFTSESPTPIYVRPQDNALLKVNYRGHINDNIAIEPHLLYRYHKELPDQLEATVIFHLLHIVWVGGSYRQDAGFVGLIGAKFWEKMGIGYSYEYGSPNTASLLGPTHEIHVGYHLGTKKDHAAHVSSFIKSHRSSAAERAREAELERQRKLQALQKSRQPVQSAQKDDELGLLAGAPKEEKPKSATNWNYEKENEPVERVNKYGETERGIKFDRVNEKGEKEVVFSWLPPPPPGSTEETYQIANPDEEPLIRTRPDGTKEAGIKWIRTIDGGEKETLVIWNEILSAEEADQIDHNPAVAMSMKEAVISIRQAEVAPPKEEEPVVQEPVVEEPIVVEEKPEEIPVVKEEPVVEEPVVIEEKPKEEPVVVTAPIEEEKTKGDSTLTKDFRSTEELAKSNEPLEVTRGNHRLELPAGNYVVAGVFSSFGNADNESDRLFQRGYHDTKVGYLTARGYYYVVIFESDNVSKANAEKRRISQVSGMSGVWVLKVNEGN